MGRTPHLAASLAAISLAAACADPATPSVDDDALCASEPVPISAIQGDGPRSPLEGQVVLTQGIVTFVTPSGAYIESSAPDDNPTTSEGLFVATHDAVALETGTRLSARGQVSERGERHDTQTVLTSVEQMARCALNEPLPITAARLPLAGPAREALESMRIGLDSASIATDVYRLREGGIRVAADRMLAIPTEIAWPGEDARRQKQENRDAGLNVQLADGDRPVFPAGTEIVSDQGVLGHDGKTPVLYLEAAVNLARPMMPVLPTPRPDSLRVLGLNLYNYFNGDGHGEGFPAPRGARTERDFERQRERLRAAMEALMPDIVAVMELENDGFSPASAATDFLEDLAAATGAPWQAANPAGEPIGTDEITVGLFHRTDRVKAAGPALALDAAPFDLLSRTPLARAYAPAGGGPAFYVSVNHFKSKGRCPDQGADRDIGDGQGCWNAARTTAAQAVGEWVLELANAQTEGRALIIGDLNAYRLEDPVRHLLANGFDDLTGGGELGPEYSFVFYGEAGTLDHLLATPALRRHAIQARVLHINAAWPPGMSLPAPWLRSSDHDPVIVDFRFRQSSTAY